MKKLLIVFALLVLFIKFSPFEEVNEFVDQQEAAFWAWIDKVSDPNLRVKAVNVIEDLGDKWQQFSQEEQDYLRKITASEQDLRAFFGEYCQGDKLNPVLFGKRLEEVCRYTQNALKVGR